MAKVEASIEVVGAGSVTLPVIFSDPGPITLGSALVEIDFQVHNTLDREVAFSALVVETDGPSAGKLSVGLLSTSMVIPAGEMGDNRLSISPNEPMTEGDSAIVRITGEEE